MPSTNSPNDTGRYVEQQRVACESHLLSTGQDKLTQFAFDAIVRPACSFDSIAFFLFITAFALPLSIVLFSNWGNKSLIYLYLGLLVSVPGFELMTNALRQDISIFFLVGSFYFKRSYLRLLFLAIALLIHDSSWVFAPLVLILPYIEQPSFKFKVKNIIYIAILVTISAFSFIYLFLEKFSSKFGDVYEAFFFYSSIYKDDLSIAFLMFIIIPVYWIYFVRKFLAQNQLGLNEKVTFWYSSLIFVSTTIFFPAITYRFALTSTVLQILLAMRSKFNSARSSFIIFIGIFIHGVVFATFSQNFTRVINGL